MTFRNNLTEILSEIQDCLETYGHSPICSSCKEQTAEAIDRIITLVLAVVGEEREVFLSLGNDPEKVMRIRNQLRQQLRQTIKGES